MKTVYIETDLGGIDYVRDSWDTCTYSAHKEQLEDKVADELLKLTLIIDFSIRKIKELLND